MDKQLNRLFQSCFFTRISLFCRKLFYAIIYYVTTLLTIISQEMTRICIMNWSWYDYQKSFNCWQLNLTLSDLLYPPGTFPLVDVQLILVGHALMLSKLRISPKIIYSSEIISPAMRNYFSPDLIFVPFKHILQSHFFPNGISVNVLRPIKKDTGTIQFLY